MSLCCLGVVQVNVSSNIMIDNFALGLDTQTREHHLLETLIVVQKPVWKTLLRGKYRKIRSWIKCCLSYPLHPKVISADNDGDTCILSLSIQCCFNHPLAVKCLRRRWQPSSPFCDWTYALDPKLQFSSSADLVGLTVESALLCCQREFCADVIPPLCNSNLN